MFCQITGAKDKKSYQLLTFKVFILGLRVTLFNFITIINTVSFSQSTNSRELKNTTKKNKKDLAVFKNN